ncbi:MAG: hypothetical protein U9N59_07160 [Campylobacterota bacterium]|nr:hypothetical protein [Campylobacterota bacterium]
MYITASNTSREYFKSLATTRGYWGVYGAKELNASVEYKYKSFNNAVDIYTVKATKTVDEYNWTLDAVNGGIKKEDIFQRKLKVLDSNTTLSYKVN